MSAAATHQDPALAANPRQPMHPHPMAPGPKRSRRVAVPADRSFPARPCAGFTLVELLVVIGILGLLAWAFLPSIISSQDSGMRTETQARMTFLSTAAEAYARKKGNYPPDDFNDPGFKVSAKPDNGVNGGIESLVLYTQSAKGLPRLSDHEDWLANTDGDENGAVIEYLDRSSRPEVVDLWGTPFAYFSAWNDGFGKEQKIMLANGEIVTAKAWKHPEGHHLGSRKFQIVSAGQDLIFNTDDDLVFPARPIE